MPSLQTQIIWMKRARLAVAGVTVLSVALFYAFAYRPSTRRLREIAQLTTARQIELRANQAKSSIKTEIAAKNERLKLELERIRKPSKDSDFSQLVKDLTMYAQQSSLHPFSFKPGVPVRSDLFMEQPVLLTFEGDFVSVSNFVRSVEDMQRLTRIRNMSIRTTPDRAGAGKVQATVSLNIYYSIE